MSATTPTASAQELLESRNCRFPGCVLDASDSPRKGPWANLCAEHRNRESARQAPPRWEQERAAARSNGQGSREAVRAAVKGDSLEARARALPPAAKKLERACNQRKQATVEAKAALAEFNDALNVLREGAQALLTA